MNLIISEIDNLETYENITPNNVLQLLSIEAITLTFSFISLMFYYIVTANYSFVNFSFFRLYFEIIISSFLNHTFYIDLFETLKMINCISCKKFRYKYLKSSLKYSLSFENFRFIKSWLSIIIENRSSRIDFLIRVWVFLSWKRISMPSSGSI